MEYKPLYWINAVQEIAESITKYFQLESDDTTIIPEIMSRNEDVLKLAEDHALWAIRGASIFTEPSYYRTETILENFKKDLTDFVNSLAPLEAFRFLEDLRTKLSAEKLKGIYLSALLLFDFQVSSTPEGLMHSYDGGDLPETKQILDIKGSWAVYLFREVHLIIENCKPDIKETINTTLTWKGTKAEMLYLFAQLYNDQLTGNTAENIIKLLRQIFPDKFKDSKYDTDLREFKKHVNPVDSPLKTATRNKLDKLLQ